MVLKFKHGDLSCSASSYDLKNLMSWLGFFLIWKLAEISVPKCHSFILCETYWGRRSVRSALQESDPLIYRALIRLALRRFYQDEVAPSFCVSPPSACSPLPRQRCVSPSLTTPRAQVMMQFLGGVLFPYIATCAAAQVLFELRVHGGLIISWTVSLHPLHDALLKCMAGNTEPCCVLHFVWSLFEMLIALDQTYHPVHVLRVQFLIVPALISYSTGPSCFGSSDCAIKC